MKPLENMTEDEYDDFLESSARMAREMVKVDKDQFARPAIVCLWAVMHYRSLVNANTQFEIDPNSLVDDAIRAGCLMLENMAKVMTKDPPPDHIIGKHSITAYLGMLRRLTEHMRRPAYRPVVHAVIHDFFLDQKEQGNL